MVSARVGHPANGEDPVMRLTSVLLVLITVTACGNGGGTASSPPPAPTPSALFTPPPVAFDEAAGIAARDGRGGRVTRLHLYGPQPPIVWLAAVLGGDGVLAELRVDATTGKVVDRQAADPEAAGTAAHLVAGDEIGVAGAREAAAKAVPGGWITAAGLEERRGGVVWAMEAVDPARRTRKIEVDAATAATRIVP